MSVVDLDVDLPEVRTQPVLLRRVRALSTVDQLALSLIVVAVALVIAAIVLPFASTTTEFGKGPRQADAFTGARALAQGAYYLIWAVIVAAGVAAVLDRVRRPLWFGVAMGAFGGQVLLMTPVLNAPQLITPVRQPLELTNRGAGWDCVVVALLTALVALVMAVRGRILPPGRRSAATGLIVLAYLLALVAQRLTWIRLNTTAQTAADLGMTVRSGPAVVFGTWSAIYGVAWTATLALAGAALFARRGRPALVAAAAAALVTLGSIVANPLQQPVPFFDSVFIPVDISRQRVIGAYVIVVALALLGAAIVTLMGRRSWPPTWWARSVAALTVAAAGLGVAAQLRPWYYARSSSAAGVPMTLGIYVRTPLLAYTLTSLVALAGLAGTAYATGTARRMLLGLGTAGVAGQMMVLVPVLRHLGLLLPSPLPGSDDGARSGVGLPLAIAALAALTAAAIVAWLPELIALGRRTIPVAAIAAAGLALAVLGQTWHWAVVHFYVGLPVPGDPGSFLTPVYPLAMSPGATLPLIVAWLIVIGAGTAGLLTTGRLRRRLLDAAVVAIVAQAGLTAFDTRLAGSAAEQTLMGAGQFVGRTTYSPGMWITYGAVVLFAAWLLMIRRAGAGVGAGAGAGELDGGEEPVIVVPVDEHALYRRPTP